MVSLNEDRSRGQAVHRDRFGTWALAAVEPKRFAAIAPVCGGGDPKSVGRFWYVPVWCFYEA